MTIRIPKALQRDLQAVSRQDDIPLSELVRQSLRNYLRIRKFRQLRKTVSAYAQRQGILTDDDVL